MVRQLILNIQDATLFTVDSRSVTPSPGLDTT